jgi:hypothetical protein
MGGNANLSGQIVEQPAVGDAEALAWRTRGHEQLADGLGLIDQQPPRRTIHWGCHTRRPPRRLRPFRA